MEGRWTIHVTQTGSLAVGARRGEYPAVPVVPCDDAAIERAVAAVREMAATGLRSRDIVETVFRAAGETER